MDNSHLAKLPAELANQIYELVFANEEPISIMSSNIDPNSFERYPSTTRTRPIALTQTCRAIRQDTILMFYASIIFSFDSESDSEGDITASEDIAHRFLESLEPAHAAAIRYISLQSDDIDVYPSEEKQVSRQLMAELGDMKLRAGKVWAVLPECEVAADVALWDCCDDVIWVRFWYRGTEVVGCERSLKYVEEELMVHKAHGAKEGAEFFRLVERLVRKVREQWVL